MEINAVAGMAMATAAGLATGIGSLIALFAKRTNTRFLAVSLGLSAGVMLYVSFMELLPDGMKQLAALYDAPAVDDASQTPRRWGEGLAVLAFFGGIAVVGLIDRLVPSYENPHEPHRLEELHPTEKNTPSTPALHRMGVMSALAVAIHNFPEGMATFMAAADSPRTGWPVAMAVAIHNIPEGIAVSVPLYYATGDRRKAFRWSFLSGLAEPAGALLGWLLLSPWTGPGTPTLGLVFAMVAGIMVFISLDELLPSAQKFGEHHAAIWGLVAGMAVMAASLLLF